MAEIATHVSVREHCHALVAVWADSQCTLSVDHLPQNFKNSRGIVHVVVARYAGKYIVSDCGG